MRRAARSIGDALGRTNPLITAARPLYDAVLALSSRGRGIEQRINGLDSFRVDPRYRVHFPETYEPAVSGFLRASVRPGAVVVNVGAHVGVYALCLARWAGPTGRVFAFEPNPLTRAVLERHVALNDLSATITVMAHAVSDTVGEEMFFAGSPGLTGSSGLSRLGRPNPNVPNSVALTPTVPVTTIDAFCAERAVVPDWLIVDVEGYEVAVLRGARETIEACRGRLGIIVEIHPSLWPASATSRADFDRLLEELGLEPVALTGQRDALDDYGVVRFAYAGPSSGRKGLA